MLMGGMRTGEMPARATLTQALPILVPLMLAGLWGAALGAVHLSGDMWFLNRVEATMTDIRTVLRGVKPAPDLVTIVAIDDELVRNEGGYPLDRATIARILDAVARLGPKGVAIDLLLADRGTDTGDQALVSSLSRNNAVLGAAAVFSGSAQQLDAGEYALSDIPKADHFLLPLRAFADVAATGVVNVATDQTGTPRFVPMVFTDGDRIEPSFALRAAALAAGEDPRIEADGILIGGRFVATDLGHVLPLAFYGPRGTIRTISAVGRPQRPRGSRRYQRAYRGDRRHGDRQPATSIRRHSIRCSPASRSCRRQSPIWRAATACCATARCGLPMQRLRRCCRCFWSGSWHGGMAPAPCSPLSAWCSPGRRSTLPPLPTGSG